MTLGDVNVWLALALSRHVHHRVAQQWLETVSAPRTLFFCRATQHALLRLLTNPAVLAPYGNAPLTNNQAWEVYGAFTADERIALRSDEPPNVETLWKQYALRDTSSPKLWMDAYLAAFGVAGGMRILTTDIAFRQFTGADVLVIG